MKAKYYSKFKDLPFDALCIQFLGVYIELYFVYKEAWILSQWDCTFKNAAFIVRTPVLGLRMEYPSDKML